MPEMYRLRTISGIVAGLSMTSSVSVWNFLWSGVISSPGRLVVRKRAPISVLWYTASLAKASLFMFSVGLVRSNISRLPSFTKAKRLPIERNWVWKLTHGLVQSPGL